MKKIIMLSLLLLLGGYNLMAQAGNTSMNKADTLGITATAYASLPVLETYVSQDVIDKMKNKYGNTLYDITAVAGTSNQTQYVVRSLKNGQYTTDYINESGNNVSK
jgi:hypothetical protein